VLVQPLEHRLDAARCHGDQIRDGNLASLINEQVIESLQHIADVSAEVVHQTLPSPFIFGYRNKMEFSFTANRWLLPEELAQPEVKKGYALGLHVPDFFDRVMHIEKCWLQDDTMNDILKFAQEYFNDQRFSIFNLRSHRGLLRFLVIRKSFSRNQYMVNVQIVIYQIFGLEYIIIHIMHITIFHIAVLRTAGQAIAIIQIQMMPDI